MITKKRNNLSGLSGTPNRGAPKASGKRHLEKRGKFLLRIEEESGTLVF